MIDYDPTARRIGSMTMTPADFDRLADAIGAVMADPSVARALDHRARYGDPSTYTPTRNRWDVYWQARARWNADLFDAGTYRDDAVDTALRRLLPDAPAPAPLTALPHPATI